MGPWPWAPHQRTSTKNYNIFWVEITTYSKVYRAFKGLQEGHYILLPLKTTPSSVFMTSNSFLLLMSHPFLFLLSCSGLSWLLYKFSIVQDLQFPAASFGSSPLFLQYNKYKIVIQQNIGHRFFCIVIIYNFLVSVGIVIPNFIHNAIYPSINIIITLSAIGCYLQPLNSYVVPT